MNPYQQAVDDELVCAHLGVTHPNDSFAQARKNLDALILWHCQLAIDPAVNGGFILVDIEVLKRALKADASIGANAIQLADGWKAMAELRTRLARGNPPCEKSE